MAVIGVGALGQASLLCAWVVAAYGLAAALLGGLRRRPELVASAAGAAAGVAGFATLAAGLLLYALVADDFSLRYVAEVSSRDAPLAVTLSSFWGGQPGSLLFWAWGLTLLSLAVVAREGERHRALMPGVLATLFAVQLFFLGVLGLLSSPFEPLPSPAADGRGLNPLLWDDGMRVHPPLLLAGYLSFSAPFAFAVGALATGRLGREWLAPVRRWMLLAWAVQGAGLLAGAWWAYHVLGWGGYWGWDPVENVALLPWLTATAFLHSVLVQERRGMLKVWNLALAIASFALAVFGTFVVRSGILSSVHSFAQSPLGPYFFGFLGVVLVGALGLFCYRLPELRAEGEIESLASREAAFLLNNLLLVGVAAVTFWGTIFPLLSELVQGAKVSVGAPFYQQVNGPLLLGLLVLMGIGPLLAWRRTSAAGLWRTLRWPLLVGGAVGLVLFGLGVRRGLAAVAFAAAAFTLATLGLEFWRGARARRGSTGEPYPVALARLVARARRRYGGYVVHLGMVFVAVGVVGSSSYQVEELGALMPGQALTVGRYTLVYAGLEEWSEPGVGIAAARLAVRADGADLGELRPARRVHRGWESQPTTVVAIRTMPPWLDDLYVMLTGWDEQGAATFRAFVNPLVVLVWVGGAFFLLGTLVVAWPEGVRQPASVPPTAAHELVAVEA